MSCCFGGLVIQNTLWISQFQYAKPTGTEAEQAATLAQNKVTTLFVFLEIYMSPEALAPSLGHSNTFSAFAYLMRDLCYVFVFVQKLKKEKKALKKSFTFKGQPGEKFHPFAEVGQSVVLHMNVTIGPQKLRRVDKSNVRIACDFDGLFVTATTCVLACVYTSV